MKKPIYSPSNKRQSLLFLKPLSRSSIVHSAYVILSLGQIVAYFDYLRASLDCMSRLCGWNEMTQLESLGGNVSPRSVLPPPPQSPSNPCARCPCLPESHGYQLGFLLHMQTTAEEHKESWWTAWLVASHAPLLPAAMAKQCAPIFLHPAWEPTSTFPVTREEQKRPQKLRAHLFFSSSSSIILYMFKNLSEES